LVANDYVVESRGDVSHVFIEEFKTASALDLAPGVCKHGTIPRNDLDLAIELSCQFLQPALGNIGPNTKHVGVVVDLNL
jgi:hypothetical protein